ncbi:F-box domain-containing protein [Diaporthe helianthi]|uniref:F-box domain-containing protein n=1 Tax=Diaporthe helianthi TaxID=158607 RepID=A0A2P5HR84_DIAHE|nr:F-box domain-containing protein [Diaporthe helianthi]
MESDTVAQAAPPAGLQFTDLPQELQKEIISHCHQPELICLSLVSKHFRALAAAELYRNFHIVFPDEDDPAFDSPIDGLAGGLETFVTSDYDYAKHLRDISLDTLSAGDKAETAYKPYLYSVSCGKFLNTLLLLTLRKARALETLRWNIRVELSRPVYKALHSIDTLSHLHIRLQAGPSLYERPPPLPLPLPGATPFSSSHHLPLLDAQPPPPTFATLPSPPPPFYIAPYVAPPTSSLPPLQPPPKPPAKTKAFKKSSQSKNPPTLSGFQKLKTLSVLDIDDLDVVTELKTCVRNSHSTLSKLKLSFSHSMAMRARKPPPDIDPDDSDPDDEFQVVPVAAPPPVTPYDEISGPARAFRAQEERRTQESVLGRIFDVEPYVVKKPAKKPRDKEDEAPSEEKSTDPGQCFINSIKAVSEKLIKDLAGSDDLRAVQQEILDTIETAARTYVAEAEGKAAAPKENGVNGDSSSSGSETNGTAEPDVPKTEDAQSGECSLFESKKPKGKELEQDADPDDINIEEPVEDSFVEEPSEIATPEPANGSEAVPSKASASNGNGITKASANGNIPLGLGFNDSSKTANLSAQKQNFKTLAEKLETFEVEAGELRKEIQGLPIAPGLESENRMKAADLRMTVLSTNIKDIQSEMATVAAEIEAAEKQDPATALRGGDGVPSRITEYARSTRGLSLQTLSIYLIPVKASVLSKAVDLRVLKRITLLNVGNQAPIWSLLAKENKQQPIALRKIFTDNVSVPFLTLVSQLEELNELFMLERPDKYKPEPFAPKTAITIGQIRHMVLKRHLPTLKRLMIKNQQDSTWDVDDRIMLLICRRGQKLEELAVSMGIRAIHTTLQHISGLVNLRALHIINLRNDDTCVWVMRETKRFVIDTLSHYPELKLEWLAIDDDDRVDRILRMKELRKGPMKGKSTKSKGKEKVVPLTSLPNSDHFPVLTLDNFDLGSDSDEDDDELAFNPAGTSKLETIDNIHFYDVWGVRVFKREVVTGRL